MVVLSFFYLCEISGIFKLFISNQLSIALWDSSSLGSWMVPLLGSINKSPECSWNCAQESSAPLLFGTYCSLSWNSKPCFSWTLFLSHLLVWLVQYVAACVTMVCRCCKRYVKDQSVYNLMTFRPATPHPYPHPLQQCSGVWSLQLSDVSHTC